MKEDPEVQKRKMEKLNLLKDSISVTEDMIYQAKSNMDDCWGYPKNIRRMWGKIYRNLKRRATCLYISRAWIHTRDSENDSAYYHVNKINSRELSTGDKELLNQSVAAYTLSFENEFGEDFVRLDAGLKTFSKENVYMKELYHFSGFPAKEKKT